MDSVEGFPNYVATTKDPGPLVLVIVLTYMLVVVVVLPLLVPIAQSYEEWRMQARRAEEVDENIFNEDSGHRQDEVQDFSGKGVVLSTSIMAGEILPADGTTGGAGASHVGDENAPDNEFRTAPTLSTASPSIAPEGGTSKEASGNERDMTSGLERTGGKKTAPKADNEDDEDDADAEVSTSYLPTNVVVNVGGGRGYPSLGKGVVDVSSVLTAEGNITPPMKRTPVPSPTREPPKTVVQSRVTGILDRLMIPSYSEDEKRSTISGSDQPKQAARKEKADSRVSAATTSAVEVPQSSPGVPGGAMQDDSPSRHTNVTGGRAPLSPSRMLDAAGCPGGRRRRHGMGFIRFDVVSRSLLTEEAAELRELEFSLAQQQNRVKATTGKDEALQEGEHGSGSGGSATHGLPPPPPSGIFRSRHSATALPVRPANKSMSDVASEALSISGDDMQLEVEPAGEGTPVKRSAAGAHVDWATRRSPQLRTAGSFYADTDEQSGLKCNTTFDADDIGPNDAPDADDPGREPPVPTARSPLGNGGPNNAVFNPEKARITLCCGPHAVWKPRTLAEGLDALVNIAEPDRESKRLLLLAMPQTTAQIIEAALRLAKVVLVGHFLGTDSLAAFVVVEVLMGVTDELLAGITDAENMICSEALANGDCDKAGQYMQIAVVLYVICSIPLLACWVVIMDDMLMFLGLPENIVFLGMDYAQVVAIHYLMEGVAQCYGCALDVTGREGFRTWVKIAEVTTNVVLLATLASSYPVFMDLVAVAFLHLVVGIVFFLYMLFWGLTRGWLRPFWTGLVGTFALKNVQAVKTVAVNAIPLSVGSFLQYGQFEVLTFFIAHLGPAEVTAWALLGCIWELLEASVEGLAMACAIRVAFHLTRGTKGMAALSAMKAVLLSAFSSLLVTAMFYVGARNLILVLTSDVTLQNLLHEVVPLVGLANVPLTFSTMCWSILGTQGRYRRATLVVCLSSWLVAMPLAAVLVFYRLDLQGVVGAVAVGHVTSFWLLACLWFRSDWKNFSGVLRGSEEASKELGQSVGDKEHREEEEKKDVCGD